MSTQAPAKSSPGPRPGSRPPGGSPPGRENVFTRKIGPLPMWVWLAIIGLGILVYVMFFNKKKGGQGKGKSGQQGGRGRGGFGWSVWPPHIRHHRHRGGDQAAPADTTQQKFASAMPPPNADGTALESGVDREGVNRRRQRGDPVPGNLAMFKAAPHGATPSLQDVANRYGTSPDAIIAETEGRGGPADWTRYVSRHDWGAPLPPATELSILAHPQLASWPRGR